MLSAAPADFEPGTKLQTHPLIIGHRGASGYVPEHTLGAYALAVTLGADYIEPDLVMTKDGQLIARHDNELGLTTDVAAHPEFAQRKRSKSIDGIELNGWFSEDFTLAELKTLRAIERIPTVRPGNARLNGSMQIPTLQEIIDLSKDLQRSQGRQIGLYIETKHPTYFQQQGLSMEKPLLKILKENGLDSAKAPIYIQSFEVNNLKQLSRASDVRLIQLYGEGQPFDQLSSGTSLTYEQMATPQGFKRVAKYAVGVGPHKSAIIALDSTGALNLANATRFVADAHAAELKVHPYTFRAENSFLPTNLRKGDDPNARGDIEQEVKIFLEAGIDGLFMDQPDIGITLRNPRK
ncbi:glycerophosphodiester phosphodiesterase [Pseudomonas sp. NPDC078700]|uniref:glycerophosphodiester phosphodiesterase n=1 Tax=Pseudomonas sp. NPDC078700 TaxID=3364424 RepID=UPI0037C61C37